MRDLFALTLVALVALAGMFSVNPTGALAGVQCAQIISSEGVGVLYCASGEQKSADLVFPVRRAEQLIESGNKQVGLDWKERDGLTYYKTTQGSYSGTLEIYGSPGPMFSGEDYVNRRKLQRSETFK